MGEELDKKTWKAEEVGELVHYLNARIAWLEKHINGCVREHQHAIDVKNARVSELEQYIDRLKKGILEIDAAFQQEFPMLAFTAKIREIAAECLRSLEEAADDL